MLDSRRYLDEKVEAADFIPVDSVGKGVPGKVGREQ